MFIQRFLRSGLALGALGCACPFVAACGSSPTVGGTPRHTGQSVYESAPMPGTSAGARGGAPVNAGAAGAGSSGSSGAGSASAAPSAPAGGGSQSTPRQVQETDIYRVDGNRLYYLNSYRGLMVFDISDVDHPALIGRSPIFGDPQEMIVTNGVAVVVVGDWYGTAPDGSPFYGSIARGLDCTDPGNIKNTGEAYLGGWVQDTRVVGSVLYTVAENDGWQYGWGYGATNYSPTVSIASVSFAGGLVTKVGEKTFAGTGGVFNVTPNAILLATQHITNPSAPYDGPAQTDLRYVDISDPGGTITVRGGLTIDSWVSGWGPDNGRWNLDFADNAHAHAIGCTSQYCGSDGDTYLLTTVDFANPDAPAVASALPIANLGWSAAARFDVDPSGSYAHMYLSPSGYYTGNTGQTPLSIYDLSKPSAPQLVGQTGLDGQIWLFMPQGQQLFALGNTYSNGTYDQSLVDVQYVDVSNPTAPKRLGATEFGSGWAWSPAADTFKAFIIDATKGLAVIPFSGWDSNSQGYNNGLELVQFTPTALVGSGTAHTKGWVQRGIFVGTRLLSLSDQALAVVDYSNPALPNVVSELTLARNVVNAQPQGATIAELSSDWWGNDTSTSEMRVLPIGDAAETTDNGRGVSVPIRGVDAQVFQNGTLGYVVTDVQIPVPCGPNGYGPRAPNGQCLAYTQEIQVVDTSNGGAALRGSVTLPILPYSSYGGWGWEGFYYYDWYNGADVVQVGGDALAFRRWYPQYAPGPNGPVYEDDLDALYVVDLSNPDAPAIASLTVTDDLTTWWGNMKAIGNTLYATDFRWMSQPDPNAPYGTLYTVRYYLDQIDLTDRAHPRIGQRVNVPGVLVGASSEDATMLYFADYWYDGPNERNDISVCKLDGGACYLQSVTELDGYVGSVIVQNDRAYTTVQEYDWMLNNNGTYTPPYFELHQLDLSNPQAPVDRIATDPNKGWGWLLGVAGDRAVVTSGWGQVAVDVYRLSANAAPSYEQSVRTLGWYANALTRQDNTLYLSSGYWGVQPIVLQ